MSNNRLDNIMNLADESIDSFIDISVDALAESDIKFFKLGKAIYKIAHSSINLVRGERESNEFLNFKDVLKKDLKKLKKSNTTDERHLRELLKNMKIFFEGSTLLDYFDKEDELVELLRRNADIDYQSELPKLFVKIVMGRLTELVTAEEWSKYIFTKLNQYATETKQYLKDLIDKQINSDNKVDTVINMLYELMRKIDSMLTSQTLTQSGIKDDSESYLNDFERRLFLDTDSPEINLKSMYVSPRIAENEDLFAADEIMKWYNDWDDYSPTTMFVFGGAGVGKSSLCAKMKYDAENSDSNDKKDFQIPNEKLHICRLRSNIRRIEKQEELSSIRDLIGLLFNIDADKYEFDRDIFVLDGFDEFCVLTKNEKLIKIILDKIAKFVSSDFKIIITSRKSKQYFSDCSLVDSKNVKLINLKWFSSCVKEWCDKYKDLVKSEEIENWCSTFPKKYDNFPKNDEKDKRYEIFCVPVILYISANTKINVDEHNSVGKIYDRAFREIAHRNHGVRQEGMDNFNEDEEEKQRLINWQFTKEAAYQMFLNDTLYISDTRDSKLLNNAKTRTVAVLKERGVSIKTKDIEIPQYLAMFHFARQGNDGTGIEFAHKTVYEYFTAVKLYEDYFAEITADYPENFEKKTDAYGNEITPLENVWTNIIEAFRYKSIDENIFTYLNKINRPVYNGKVDYEGERFDFKMFEKYYVEGMEQRILADLIINKRVKEYVVNCDLLATQMGCAFRNLTWFLTENEFYNKNDGNESKKIREYISYYYSDLNIKNWNLGETNLCNIKLSGVKFSGVNLYKSILSESYLKGISMDHANLSLVNFMNVDLQESELNYSDLCESILDGANLTGAKLIGANLKESQLNDVNLRFANLMNANLYRSNVTKSDLTQAKLIGADLTEANLIGSNFYNADLRKSIFINSELIKADLSRANLEYANMTMANLHSCNLYFANLKHTNFCNANLRLTNLIGANFKNAHLNGAKLKGAKYCCELECKTEFPEGFNPEEHNMIKVDRFGDPII